MRCFAAHSNRPSGIREAYPFGWLWPSGTFRRDRVCDKMAWMTKEQCPYRVGDGVTRVMLGCAFADGISVRRECDCHGLLARVVRLERGVRWPDGKREARMLRTVSEF